MCYNFNNKGVNLKKALQDFDATDSDQEYTLQENVKAFAKTSKPTIPAIVNHNGIVLMNTFWGAAEIKKYPTSGLNLKSENTHTFYRKIQNNRCLIPASSYYEHMTFSVPLTKRVLKIKHEMFWKNKEQFYIGAFYDVYKDGNIGFGLVTTIPNEVQAAVHDRMIMTFDVKMGREFLDNKPIEEFQFPNYSPDLLAVNLEPEKLPFEISKIQVSQSLDGTYTLDLILKSGWVIEHKFFDSELFNVAKAQNGNLEKLKEVFSDQIQKLKSKYPKKLQKN